MREFVADAEALEHIARLEARARAGRARRARDVLDAHEERLALDIAEADVEDVRHAPLCVAVHLRDLEARGKLALELAAQAEQTLALGVHLVQRELARLAEADDSRDIQRARAHAALVAAAVQQRLEAHARVAAAHIEGAHALRAVHLVARPRHQVDVVLLDIGRHLADPLRGVGVEDRAALMAERTDLGHLADGADLVVRPHDRDEDRVLAHRLCDHRASDHTIGRRREEGDIEAFVLKPLARVEHGLVLVRRGDDVAASLRAIGALRIHASGALDREVVRLGRAARPDDLLGRRADERCGLLAGEVDGVLRFPAELVVAARGVAEFLGEVRKHRFDHTGVRAGRGGVVHVDGQLDCHRQSLLIRV